MLLLAGVQVRLPDGCKVMVNPLTGRHPCTGQKFAKLEIKILITLFLASYQYELVNKDGVFPEHPPAPNYNDLHKVFPCFFVVA